VGGGVGLSLWSLERVRNVEVLPESGSMGKRGGFRTRGEWRFFGNVLGGALKLLLGSGERAERFFRRGLGGVGILGWRVRSCEGGRELGQLDEEPEWGRVFHRKNETVKREVNTRGKSMRKKELLRSKDVEKKIGGF